MDDFPGLLARDFGYKPQGKSAPMAPPRTGSTQPGPVHSKSGPVFDDHVSSDNLLFNDVFRGPPKYSETASFDYDSVFKNKNNGKTTSLPSYDKPVYDDDIFDGLPGVKNATSSSSHSARFDDVFSSNSNAPPFDDLKSASFGGKFSDVFGSAGETRSESGSAFNDLLGNLGRKRESEFSVFDDLLGGFGRSSSPSVGSDVFGSAGETRSESGSAFNDLLGNLGRKRESESSVFDDLLGGFGRSSSPSVGRSTSESNQSRKPSSTSAKTTSSVFLESTSTPPATSTVVFTDPLDEISRFSGSGSTKANNSSANRGVFQDLDPLDGLGKSVPPMSSETNKRGNNRSPSRSVPSVAGSYAPTSGEPVDKYPVENAEDFSQKKRPVDDFQDETLFDMPAASTDFRGTGRHTFSPPPYESASLNETILSPRSEGVAESSDDVWLTVSEIPLSTQLTSAPPPSRPPPPRPPRTSKSSNNSRKKVNEYSSYSNSNHYSQSPGSAQTRSSAPSPIDELEDFAKGQSQNSVNKHADFFPGAEAETNSSAAAASAAAMKEAMDKAEAKFRQMREREHLKSARTRDSGQLDRDMQDSQLREARERQERLDRERLQKEREEEERELRRLEKEREREREREREEKEREQRRLEREKERAREIERDRARQAVERATREARERAAADARLKAERAAVEKAQAEARERAERIAVQRAQAEARERAAAEAKERAERAAADVRERANAEAREKVEARARAERAAVERAAAEARERAAADARERAAAAARANQQKNENLQRNNDDDLESFFSSRASSAPRPRANTSDPLFDTQTKAAPETTRRTSVGVTSSIRKASSTTNIVDDLSSIFGAPGPSGEFQDIEGETDERRRARLERHQRTQERAAKALAEKNQRDLQAQNEQAERHRIAETLDVEIKRWAAGKEGNLRALLSTLQYVLWPECGWQPVSLTDLITAAAVKKVYRKATLCIHPDKVQQKGANLQQKYIAEKVFDLLKEAWNKFNSEELF